ncbi:hypothetical protein X801_07760 [Opisthorchis viverrini]|uniref:Uncharacterized protein n=1 Tax=Opisthorchis viverrini TaxID=6198 RepID=A0A1S8WPQ4_OPIVI|nr:hypothetical protein X801_07760 [Opisthorchis viverrini]
MIYQEERTRDAAYCDLCFPFLTHLVWWHHFAYHLSNSYKDCRTDLREDTPIDQSCVKEWTDWIDLVTSLGKLRQPRRYGVAAYVGFCAGLNRPCCRLLFGKSRVPPLETVSIPRPELTAAVLVVKIFHIITKSLKDISFKGYFRTDSQIVLRYINDVCCKSFGIRDKAFLGRWLDGPDWLHAADELPIFLPAVSGFPKALNRASKCVNAKCSKAAIGVLFRRYFHWFQPTKAVVRWLRFLKYLEVRLKSSPTTVSTGYPTVQELRVAKYSILPILHSECYAEEAAQIR